MIVRVCLENWFYYIENGNARENDLFKDGYIYKISSKKFLSHNFFADWQMYDAFLKKRTWSPNIGRRKTLV